MKYLSICSGIEAATVAWEPLGWRPVAFSEIEAFPSAVLESHYPNVPNLGDMTKIEGAKYAGSVDVLVGGTPCQAFSVAGLRAGLIDPRGNLTLVFAQLADDIQPPYIVWENVPGVLSSKDNAFGCFLGLLAGEDDALVAPGGKWTGAGYVLGPQRTVAWRVLDAQYFGLAQRRRRVFVVACPRGGADPREILFEREGLRRDTPPSREAGEGAAADALGSSYWSGGPHPALSQSAKGSGGVGSSNQELFSQQGAGLTVACLNGLSEYGASIPTLRSKGGDCAGGSEALLCFGSNNTSGPIDVATARNSSGSASGGLDFESETFAVTGLLCANGKAAGSATQQDAEQGILAVSVALRGRDGGATAELGDDGPCHVATAMQVRRLTPRECERLQGFPDDYTLIPWGRARKVAEKEEATLTFDSFAEASAEITLREDAGWGIDDVEHLLDGVDVTFSRETGRMLDLPACPGGPRYKALGNSMAVPCMAWIGMRIMKQQTPGLEDL